MTKAVFLPPDLWEDALQTATQESFPEIIRILRLFQSGTAELTSDEASALVEFARFLVGRAELHYPYWDDSRTPYLQEHEEAFQDVNMGLHEKLVSYIGSIFPEVLR
ncbi:MAG: hypothetical protein RL701_7817 [Pseudomonadota bacterium]|jgi:hypothetical protein